MKQQRIASGIRGAGVSPRLVAAGVSQATQAMQARIWSGLEILAKLPAEPSAARAAQMGLAVLQDLARARRASLYEITETGEVALLAERGSRALATRTRAAGNASGAGKEARDSRGADLLSLVRRARAEKHALFLLGRERSSARLKQRAAQRASRATQLHRAALPLLVDGSVSGVVVLSGLAKPITDPDSELGRALLHGARLIASVLENCKRLRHLEDRAARDGLTHLYNHAAFFEILEREVSHAARYHSPLALVLIDLDAFKGVNDVHGHLRGDEILEEVAERIRTSIRGSDITARYGGDEFAVLLPQTGEEGMRVFCERLRASLNDVPFGAGRKALSLRASIGSAILTGEMSARELIERADRAMYSAKKSATPSP